MHTGVAYARALYNRLLEAAAGSIARTFQKRVALGRQSGRGFRIPRQDEQVSAAADCALVTRLVIKKP